MSPLAAGVTLDVLLGLLVVLVIAGVAFAVSRRSGGMISAHPYTGEDAPGADEVEPRERFDRGEEPPG